MSACCQPERQPICPHRCPASVLPASCHPSTHRRPLVGRQSDFAEAAASRRSRSRFSLLDAVDLSLQPQTPTAYRRSSVYRPRPVNSPHPLPCDFVPSHLQPSLPLRQHRKKLSHDIPTAFSKTLLIKLCFLTSSAQHNCYRCFAFLLQRCVVRAAGAHIIQPPSLRLQPKAAR